MTHQPYIIAEAGVNHNGELQLAKELVYAAKEAGAHAVKFQTFKAKNLASPKLSKATYQKNNQLNLKNESQFQMLERLELSLSDHFILKELCETIGIEFLSSTFDIESSQFLIKELECKKIKVGSGDLNNAPLLIDLAFFDVDVIISSGMATLTDIETALSVLAFGYTRKQKNRSQKNFKEAYLSTIGQKKLKEKVSLLHCTSEYPAPPETINLSAIKTIRNAFGLKTGFSDHTKGIHAPILSMYYGAEIIEKHFTLDKSMEGPDHAASLSPEELKDMISGIRDALLFKGDGIKIPSRVELENAKVVKKSLVFSRDMKEGEVIDEKSILIIRSEPQGLDPIYLWDVLGKKVKKNVIAFEPTTNDFIGF